MATLRFQHGLTGRGKLADLLRRRGLTGDAAEVGTHRGAFAAELLRRWPGRLFCVDHYPSGYNDADPASAGDREADRLAARAALGAFRGRVLFVRLPSVEAAAGFADGALDAVYIDADHARASVEADLAAWWPKVRPGGVLAGHDFVCPGMELQGGGWGREVQPAVMSFAGAHGLDVWLVTEADEGGWSWYTFRPGEGGTA